MTDVLFSIEHQRYIPLCATCDRIFGHDSGDRPTAPNLLLNVSHRSSHLGIGSHRERLRCGQIALQRSARSGVRRRLLCHARFVRDRSGLCGLLLASRLRGLRQTACQLRFRVLCPFLNVVEGPLRLIQFLAQTLRFGPRHGDVPCRGRRRALALLTSRGGSRLGRGQGLGRLRRPLAADPRARLGLGRSRFRRRQPRFERLPVGLPVSPLPGHGGLEGLLESASAAPRHLTQGLQLRLQLRSAGFLCRDPQIEGLREVRVGDVASFGQRRMSSAVCCALGIHDAPPGRAARPSTHTHNTSKHTRPDKFIPRYLDGRLILAPGRLDILQVPL